MSAIWLKKLSLDRLAAGDVEIDTEIALKELPRLAAAVLPESSDIALQLALRKADNKIVLLDGKIKVELKLICQRCLDAMSVNVDNDLQLALLQGAEQEEFVPDGYEALLISSNEVRVADLVEDEILLELPIAPRHAEHNCGPLRENIQALKDSTPETTNPFAGLADILRKSH